MERKLFALSLGFAGLILATQAGWAAPQCGPRDKVVSVLAEKYGEQRRGIGLAANAQVMEFYTSAQSGTWTILVTLPDGQTCLVASGEHFEMVDDPLPAKGDPA